MAQTDKYYYYGVAFIAFTVFSIAFQLWRVSTAETIVIQVRDKERATTGVGEHTSSKYVVFTEGEVFKNTDDMFFWKYNSSDVQNRLSPGHTYRVRVVGWRIPFLSFYRNIIAVDEEVAQLRV